MAPQLREMRFWRSIALFSTGALITLACTRVKVTWDQAASAAGPTVAMVTTPTASPTAGAATTAPALPAGSKGQVEDARGLSRTFAQVAEQVSPSVVAIRVAKKQKVSRVMRRGLPFHQMPFPFGGPFGGPDEEEEGGDEDMGAPLQRGAGSGVVIDDKGFILTNNHVVGGADDIKVQFQDGKELPAKIVGTDPRSDLAVISVQNKGYALKAAPLGDSEKLAVGEWVMAIGNPFGLDHTVTVGVISAKGRSGIGDRAGNYQDFLQTDASINPGNSGGPLVNLNGEVIGINTAILGPGGNIGIGFAVPSDMAKPIARELIASGKVRRPFLGISMQAYTTDMAKAMGSPEKGALVGQLTPGAPAEKAGVRRGDVIMKVDGKPVLSSRDVQRYVLARRVGDSINLELWRDGKTMTLAAKTAELPGEDGAAGVGGADDGQAGKAKLGLGLQTLTPQMAERFGLKADHGVLINAVKPGSPAAEAGLTRGDVILEVDRRPVRAAEEAVKALTADRAGGHVLLVQRGDQSMFVLVQPAPSQK